MQQCDKPRSLRDQRMREQRRARLAEPHVSSLTKFVEELRRRTSGLQIPDFDPCDGGNDAQALFLLERPGPMAVAAPFGRRFGSGFISRDNDDATAEAIFTFMRQSQIPRSATLLWNVIPWWTESKRIDRALLDKGIACIQHLIKSRLPRLRAVMFVGGAATSAAPVLTKTSRLTLFSSDHPSPKVKARWPERWNAIPAKWREVLPFIDPLPHAGACR